MQQVSFMLSRVAVGLLFSITVFTSCNKEELQTPSTPQPAPVPVANKLAIHFTANGVQLTDVDSAVVVVRNSNNDIMKWKTMTKSTAELSLELDGLANASYTASIEVYTKKRPDQTARQYALFKSFSIPIQQNVIINSPNGTFNDAWYKRAVFFEGQNDAVAVVAMDPRDAYYGVSFRDAKWVKVDLMRYSVYERALVAMKSISRNLNGTIGFTEYYAFAPYVEKMNGNSWTKAYINLYLERQDGTDVSFEYEYNND